MKRFTVVLTFLLFTVTHQVFSIGTVKVGYTFGGSYTQTTGNVEVSATDIGGGVSFSTELFLPLWKYFDIGAGVEYQSPREVEIHGVSGKLGFIPLYGVARVTMDFVPQLAAFLQARAGYNFITGNNDFAGVGIYRAELSGGLTWGLGLGFIAWKKILLEVSFSKHLAEVTIPATVIGYEKDTDVEFATFVTCLGFCF